MALTVHLTKNPDHNEIGLMTPTLVFDSDGVCCYFEPVFQEIGQMTGKFIDPWDGGAFSTPKELQVLLSVFQHALESICGLPPEVRVKTGTVMSESREEIFEIVRRDDLKQLVSGMIDFVQRAISEAGCVYFYGD